MLEAGLETMFARRVKAAGGHPVKLHSNVSGVPDRLVLWPGGAMTLVELKTATGRLSALQRLWHRRAAELGIPVVVLYGPQQVIEWVESVELPSGRYLAAYDDALNRLEGDDGAVWKAHRHAERTVAEIQKRQGQREKP